MPNKIIENYLSRFPYIKKESIDKIYISFYNICMRNNIDTSKLYIHHSGESALCFEYGDKVIKILPSMDFNVGIKDYVKYSHYILQPIDEIIISIVFNSGMHCLFSIVYENKLNLNINVSNEELLNLSNRLCEDGYAWLDIKKDNIGYDNDGELKLFDYGELFCDKYDPNYLKHLEYHKQVINKIYKIPTKKRRFFNN